MKASKEDLTPKKWNSGQKEEGRCISEDSGNERSGGNSEVTSWMFRAVKHAKGEITLYRQNGGYLL